MNMHSRSLTRSLAIAVVLLPASLSAQAAAAASGSTTGSAGASLAKRATVNATSTAEIHVPAEFSAEGKARLEAMYARAREKDVPREPMARRVAEGRAKGASEATVVASAEKVMANLEASQSAMIAAGRKRPERQEMESAAHAMDRGVTAVQIETMARKAPGDRSLVVAFDVLTQLAARGTPVTNALAQVEGKLEARATDASLTSLISIGAGTRAGGPTNAGAAGSGMAGGGAAASGAVAGSTTGAKGAGGAAGTTGGVTGTVGATVGGVIGRKP